MKTETGHYVILRIPTEPSIKGGIKILSWGNTHELPKSIDGKPLIQYLHHEARILAIEFGAGGTIPFLWELQPSTHARWQLTNHD